MCMQIVHNAGAATYQKSAHVVKRSQATIFGQEYGHDAERAKYIETGKNQGLAGASAYLKDQV